MLFQTLFYSLALIGLIILLIDLIHRGSEWYLRIHIGRCQDRGIWNGLITQRGIRWLNRTPKVKVTDNTRLIAIDMLKGNYSSNAIQHWQEASLVLGIGEYVQRHHCSKARAELEKFLSTTFDRSGQWIRKPEHVDAAILAYSVMKLEFIKADHCKPAMDYIWELIQEHIGEDGTVRYRKSVKGYRYVDTIGFVCPFLVAYGVRYNNDECIKLAVKQIKDYEQYGMLSTHHIPSHAYAVDGHIPLGLYGWGRGLGWFAIGLIDAWNELPEGEPCKEELERSVVKFAKSVLRFQQKDGSWSWSVTRNEARPDSSATATLAWFLLNAAKIQDVKDECMNSANQALQFLMGVTRRSGAVDFSQGDTKDIGVYSMTYSTMPFTQGFCIRCVNKARAIA